jgi:hypothetical protein
VAPAAYDGIGRKSAPTRSLTIMARVPSAQIRWRRTKAVIERRTTDAESCTSVSVQLDEMTVLAAGDLPPEPPDTGVELELGAYVARMRTRAAPPLEMTLDHRFPQATARWTPAIARSD